LCCKSHFSQLHSSYGNIPYDYNKDENSCPSEQVAKETGDKETEEIIKKKKPRKFTESR
jgi:hypothetical protein